MRIFVSATLGQRAIQIILYRSKLNKLKKDEQKSKKVFITWHSETVRTQKEGWKNYSKYHMHL
jgi:hypothetical protein